MPKADHVRRVTKVRHVKFQYSPAKVELALNAVSDGMAIAAASRTFEVPRTTLRNKISGEFRRESRHCEFVSPLGDKIEEQLVKWILTCAKMGIPIDKDGLLCSVQKLVREANIQTPFVDDRPGKKRYYSFMNRHTELFQKKAEYIHGGRGAVT
ncbi:hypothetical protein JTB14_029454 [Gonioctena quinquepunctata]|nr:hypothetical protein JTB14_029454 [Gonioctena quinquepunctata]